MKKTPLFCLTNVRIRFVVAFVLTLAGFSLGMLSFAKPTFRHVPRGQGIRPWVSPALRDLPAKTASTDVAESILGDTERILTGRQRQIPGVTDQVTQRTAAAAAMPAIGASFEGMNISQGCGGCLPPDTDGAVGPNHYVQAVNTAVAVYNKTTGAVIKAPTAINQLWAGTTGACFDQNDGDPIVIYDQLADRWLISQFTATAPYAECIAVSATPDPTGTYYLYEFDESPNVFHDYPHLSVWPDAYYMSTNEFPDGAETNSGAGAFAFERAKMLAGQPARFIWFDESAIAIGAAYVPGGQNPTSLDGYALPPSGAPNYFVEMDIPGSAPNPAITSAVMSIWKFHVDWNNPANSTFGVGSTPPVAVGNGEFQASGGQPNFMVPVANFVPAQCVYGEGPNCVPEKIVPGLHTATLDTLGDRVMFRATYRNFGDHESMVVHHTVVTAADTPTGATRTGLRWYEVRNLSTTPTIFQQSTFAPLDPTNPLWRFMGSAAMDHMGNIAIGYTASGPNYFPSLHYAGRLATDPPNDLTQGEGVAFAGQGIQGFPLNRWGDYSQLTVDPNDDCTFWYTNEYLPPNSLTDLLPVKWHTRIVSFKFPQCVVNPPTLLSMASRKVHGGTRIFDVDLPLTGPHGIEPRIPGPNGGYTIVFHFSNPVASCGTPSPSAGTATLDAGSAGSDCVVNLTGITSPQYVTVNLNGARDTLGNHGNVGGTLGVLVGDTNADAGVNSGDISQTKSQSGQPLGASNFREDLNLDGDINSGDISLAKSKSGTGL
jgi:hypothetical protein